MAGTSDPVLLQARGLRMAFPDLARKPLLRPAPMNEVLKGVDLTVHRGESVGLVGESGSGKTTMGRCLMRLYRPTGGSLRFDGEDYTGLDGTALRRLRGRMQMIFQDPQSSLNPRHRVGHIVAQPLLANGRAASRRAAHAAARAAMERAGLSPALATRYPHELSGGQRQRVGIARAIVLEPDFIVADEIVSGLDVSTQAQILTLLRDLKREMGLSLVFISHDLSVVRVLCDSVVVMRQGRVLETGDCARTFAAPANAYTRELIAAVALPEVDDDWFEDDEDATGNREAAMDIKGTSALVTGANRGIGKALIDALLAAGATRVYAGTRDDGAAVNDDPRVTRLKLDVTDADDIAAAAAACGDVRLLINNAGINHNDHLIGARDGDHAREEMETNYFGTLAMCRAFAPVIEGNGGGAIANMASITARAPIPLMGSLAASKAAIYSMTQSIRAELAPRGVHVMAVLPGAVDTRMTEGFPGDKAAPSDIAAAILEGLGAGTADLYPGDMAAGLSEGLAADRAGTLGELAQYV